MSPHPVAACVTSLKESLADVADVSVILMETTDRSAALVALAEVAARLEELRLRLLAGTGDAARDEGHRDAAQWLAHATRQDGAATRRGQRLAEAWTGDGTMVAAALAEGRRSPPGRPAVSPAQPTFSPPSSTRSRSFSTWAGPAGSSPPPSAAP